MEKNQTDDGNLKCNSISLFNGRSSVFPKLQLDSFCPICKRGIDWKYDNPDRTGTCSGCYRSCPLGHGEEVVRLRDCWLDTKVSADGLFLYIRNN